MKNCNKIKEFFSNYNNTVKYDDIPVTYFDVDEDIGEVSMYYGSHEEEYHLTFDDDVPDEELSNFTFILGTEVDFSNL